MTNYPGGLHRSPLPTGRPISQQVIDATAMAVALNARDEARERSLHADVSVCVSCGQEALLQADNSMVGRVDGWTCEGCQAERPLNLDIPTIYQDRQPLFR